ncbi:MAG: hypothetical protein HXX16_12775 [Bacteroidales bacterium]|nr:hypothetical protein [Bacteroidales bacterium]
MKTQALANHFEKINAKWFFLIVCLLYIVSSFILNVFVITDNLYYNALGEQLSAERISRIFEIREKFSWINYVILPLLVALKLVLVSFSLNIGALVFGHNISFAKLFKITVIAEVIFLLADLSKMAYFLMYPPHTLQEINNFYPLSLVNLFNIKEVASWLIYPLQQFNVFEFFYWLALALGLKTVLNKGYSSMLKMVASSYGVGLIIWLLLIMFLTISNG